MKKPTKSNIAFMTTGHFPSYVLVSYCKTYEEVVKWLTRKGYKDWAEAAEKLEERYRETTYWAGRSYTDGTAYFFIHLGSKQNIAERNYDIIGHEAFHLVQYVTDTFAADLFQEKESSAYLHTHFVKYISQVIKEAK